MHPSPMTDPQPATGTAATPDTGGAAQASMVEPNERLGEAAPLDFAKTLDDYEGKLLRYAATLLGTAGPGGQAATDTAGRDTQPSDLVQEAFLRLHRTCREQGSSAIAHPGTWLYRVVHNLAMDALRRRIRQRGAQDKIEDDARRRSAAADESDEAALGQLEQREMIALAMRLLGDLPQQQQKVITLKFMEGLTLRQIAEVIGSSPGSVNYHLNQGLARLAQQLRRKGLA